MGESVAPLEVIFSSFTNSRTGLLAFAQRVCYRVLVSKNRHHVRPRSLHLPTRSRGESESVSVCARSGATPVQRSPGVSDSLVDVSRGVGSGLRGWIRRTSALGLISELFHSTSNWTKGLPSWRSTFGSTPTVDCDRRPPCAIPHSLTKKNA